MTRGSLCHVATLGPCTKKANLCISTLGRKMPSNSTISSSLLASPKEAARVSESYPLMIIPPHDKKDKDGRSLCRFYDYINKKVVNTNTKIPEEVDHALCIGSSHGWLAYVSRLDCSIFLWSPFTTSPLILLPPIHTLPFIKVIPHEEIEDDEVSDYISDDDNFFPDYGFKVEAEYPDPSKIYYTRTPKGLSPQIIDYIVLSSIPTSDDCIVVAMSDIIMYQGIFFCKPGDKSWTFVEQPVKLTHRIRNLIHFKDRLFYTMNHTANFLFAYDLADLSSPKSYRLKFGNGEYIQDLCTDSLPHEEYNKNFYLVESLGDLLLVCRLIRSDIDNNEDKFALSDDDEFPIEKFEVYRLDFSRNTWEHTKCIGDQVLFLDSNQTLSLSALDFPNFKANCIYFTGYFFKCHDYGHYEIGGNLFGQFHQFGRTWPHWVMRHFH
ncbi:uncharacterized protein LOC132182223 [Corylus avellana]|uniref:uncharacterized protein LOC132182223 n=1 Tax=Corylus avellana TaxID=13451 RepID=UPI00286A02BD|nr:uncharacterized protein LOC132182223 [Corylus avellana]